MHSLRREMTALAAGALGVLFGQAPASAQSVEEFYRNARNITLVVSTAPGGGYDSYARVFARGFTRHVPGGPTIVVQNMPGAGGLRATNYIYANAVKDGSVLAHVHASMMTAPLLSVEQANFDPTKFSYVGNMAKEPQFCVSWQDAPIKTFDQVLAKQEFIVGSAGAGGSIDTVPTIMNNLFGTNIKVIGGYASGTAILLAMERGEVHGRCGWSMSSMMGSHPHWVKEKKVHFIIQTALEKHPDLPDAPLIMDYAKTEEQKGVLELVFAQQAISRPILGPPGVPTDRLAALRQAFHATMKDAEFLAEADKQGLDISPTTAEEIEAQLKRLYAMPEAIVKKALEVSTK